MPMPLEKVLRDHIARQETKRWCTLEAPVSTVVELLEGRGWCILLALRCGIR